MAITLHDGWTTTGNGKAPPPRLAPTPTEPRDPAFAAAVATLSQQEHSVLRARCQGLTEPAIGERHFMSAQTAKNTLTRIFHKLGLGGKGSSARACFLLGLEDGWQAACRRDVRR